MADPMMFISGACLALGIVTIANVLLLVSEDAKSLFYAFAVGILSMTTAMGWWGG